MLVESWLWSRFALHSDSAEVRTKVLLAMMMAVNASKIIVRGAIGRSCMRCTRRWRPCRRQQQMSIITNNGMISARQLFSTTTSATPSLTDDEEATINKLATDILSRDSGADNDSASQDMSQRMALSKSITLVESKSHAKRRMADTLLERLKKQSVPQDVPSFRLGIAGPPG